MFEKKIWIESDKLKNELEVEDPVRSKIICIAKLYLYRLDTETDGIQVEGLLELKNKPMIKLNFIKLDDEDGKRYILDKSPSLINTLKHYNNIKFMNYIIEEIEDLSYKYLRKNTED